MISRVLIAALAAGVLAGLFATAVQSWQVIPLIVTAEQFENGEVGHDHDTGQNGQAQDAVDQDHATHDHGSFMQISGDYGRLVYSALANIGGGIAFSLILTAAALFMNQSMTLQSGLIWGLAGFVTFVLAPNFGLPPELPGMPRGELEPRQIWWVATATLTAAGMALFFFRRGIFWMLLGVALIVAPHLYGAPQTPEMESPIPPALAAEFVVATMVSSLLFWLFLGGVLGLFFERAMARKVNENG